MSDLTQLSDDDLVKMFTQMSQEALGSSAPVSSEPIRTDITQATGRGSSEKLIDPSGMMAEGQIKNQLDIDKAKQMEGIQGPSGDIAGRIALARESLQNLPKIKRILFPDGSAKSFDRETALLTRYPGRDIPIIGKMLPQTRPDNPLDPLDDEKAYKAQTVFRLMGTGLSGRQLIQTGVAARPEETENLIGQFAANGLSNPKAAYDALDQLETFYKDYLKVIDPSGAKGANPDQKREDPLGLR